MFQSLCLRQNFTLEGTTSEDASGSQNTENVQILLFADFIFCSIDIHAAKVLFLFLFFASNLRTSGCSHYGLLSTNEEQKKLPHDLFDICATHAGL